MIPNSFVAGDSVAWSYSTAEYSSLEGYTAEYVFVSPAGQKTVIGAGNSTGGWDFTIIAAESATWAPGEYGWQLYVKQAAERYTQETGQIVVRENFAAQTVGADTRSYWQRVVDAIEATMEGRATSDVNQYSFNGRSLTKLTLAELQAFHGYASVKLNTYLQATGQGGRSRVIRQVI